MSCIKGLRAFCKFGHREVSGNKLVDIATEVGNLGNLLVMYDFNNVLTTSKDLHYKLQGFLQQYIYLHDSIRSR